MNDADDRLAGDLVWELFPAPEASRPRSRLWFVTEVAFVVTLCWFLAPAISAAVACLAIGLKDYREGWRPSGAIPDRAAGRVRSLFTYSWGAWKTAIGGFAIFFAMGLADQAASRQGSALGCDKDSLEAAMVTAMFLMMGAFLASATLTAAGLVMAVRSDLRVWIGEGMNRARTLLFGMLIVVFTVFVIGPMCFWFPGAQPGPHQRPEGFPLAMIGFAATLLVGPVVILTVHEWACGRILADRPGKFGPKVSTVGKWDK